MNASRQKPIILLVGPSGSFHRKIFDAKEEIFEFLSAFTPSQVDTFLQNYGTFAAVVLCPDTDTQFEEFDVQTSLWLIQLASRLTVRQPRVPIILASKNPATYYKEFSKLVTQICQAEGLTSLLHHLDELKQQK